ncbi:hypothetical protein [Pseudomonas synxantha]|uniref:hypothetical protein n=1 Tax=Pseudomonas synxantha TaxID=47883 RepID=UPI00345D22D5
MADRKLEIEQLRRSVSVGAADVTDVAYERLINITQQPWDLKVIDVKSSIVAAWLSDEGILNRLKRFRHGVNNFFSSNYNAGVDKALKPKPQAVDSLLRFGGRLDGIEIYREEVNLYNFAVLFSSRFEDGFPSSLKGDLEFDSNLFDGFNFGLDYSEFSLAIADIKSSVASAGSVELAFNELKASRDIFITKYSSEHISHEGADCPACGYDWKSREKLLLQLELQRVALETLVDANSKTLKRSIELFEQQTMMPILKSLNEYVIGRRDSIEYKKKISELSKEQVSYLKRLTQSYAAFKIDLRSFYCESLDLDEPLKINQLGDAVNSLYRIVDHDAIGDDFQEIFEQIFAGDEKAALSVELDAIDKKSAYIKIVYIRSVYGDIREKEVSLAKAEDTYRKAVYLDKALVKLRDIYNENLNSYVASIAKGIEVLFHIYSGRLLQNFQSGLGIFIETDGKSLSFRESPKKIHDVIFSMSSGQLSSLVLSFTLALNKRYARNSIMLIDDPVQTLDDINVAGFIDLLRNEFFDRQVILSTHEDEMSAYMQYKFKKYNLDAEGIDFKRALAI